MHKVVKESRVRRCVYLFSALMQSILGLALSRPLRSKRALLLLLSQDRISTLECSGGYLCYQVVKQKQP